AVRYLTDRGFELIGCQIAAAHLCSLGATDIPRRRFLRLLAKWCDAPSGPRRGRTTLPTGSAPPSAKPSRSAGKPPRRPTPPRASRAFAAAAQVMQQCCAALRPKFVVLWQKKTQFRSKVR